MDIEDFLVGFFLTIGGILIFVLVVVGIYAALKDIERKDKTNDYQKCICQKVEE